MLIEQAIFASVASGRACGYQLVSRSRGLCEADARELARWGPSHDSLLPNATGPPLSLNFHRLESGAFCVSRSEHAGAEYSGRGGEAVYTQMLIIPPAMLARFANNPFAILRAATAKGAMRVYEQIPAQLEGLDLGGRTATVDHTVLAKLGRSPGPAAMAALVQTALDRDALAVAWRGSAEQLFAGIFSLLPLECRLEFSFSTGLKFSPARPTRLLALGADPASARSLARQSVTVVDLDAPLGPVRLGNWANYIQETLSRGRFSSLASQLEPRRAGLDTSKLDALADEIQEKQSTTTGPPVLVASCAAPAERTSTPASAKAVSAMQSSSRIEVEDLSELLAAQPADVVEKLERVDDLLFDAIRGSDKALVELRTLWPKVSCELEPSLVEKSIKQYLRCALAMCSQEADDEARRADRAMAAVDVLCVLYE